MRGDRSALPVFSRFKNLRGEKMEELTNVTKHEFLAICESEFNKYSSENNVQNGKRYSLENASEQAIIEFKQEYGRNPKVFEWLQYVSRMFAKYAPVNSKKSAYYSYFRDEKKTVLGSIFERIRKENVNKVFNFISYDIQHCSTHTNCVKQIKSHFSKICVTPSNIYYKDFPDKTAESVMLYSEKSLNKNPKKAPCQSKKETRTPIEIAEVSYDIKKKSQAENTYSRLYSYIMTHDTGFSPNPFHGYCSLACCKPTIRQSAEVGDWIMGISKKPWGNKIVYAMAIAEKMDFGVYFNDKRFKKKIPEFNAKEIIKRCGDNIYKPIGNEKFRQLPSLHSNGAEEDPIKKETDLNGGFVLIAKKFWYFGRDQLELPQQFSDFIAGRGHRCNFDEEAKDALIQYIQKQKPGINGKPIMWSDNDDSWKKG